MIRKPMMIVLVLILLLWIAPLALALSAGGLASLLSCELNEGSAHPCMLFGSDIGGTLYTIGVLGWLTLIGIPFAAGALVVWAIVAVILSRRKAS
jgi:hypothetical protein